jgi:hypothetical protein
MSTKTTPISETDITWVRWNARARDAHPEFEGAIEAFDAGDLPAAQGAAAWLREHGLNGESQTYLAVVDGEVVGFYALTAGAVELSGKARKKLGVAHPTQGAVLITWLAKSSQHNIDGALLLQDAIGIAQETAEKVAATVLALDPFDRETAEMWHKRFKMRNSLTKLRTPEGEPELKRMFVPLRDPAG